MADPLGPSPIRERVEFLSDAWLASARAVLKQRNRRALAGTGAAADA